MNPLYAFLQPAIEALNFACIETPQLDARLLLQHVLGYTHEELLQRDAITLSPQQHAEFDALILRRAGYEPLSHILGVREFYGREFIVNQHVLDPRPDSEALIEAVLELKNPDAPALRILDLGTGSGCLLLTLLAELPQTTGVGVDISAQALEVAHASAKKLDLASRVNFVCSSWADALQGKFDIIISNPPYIRDTDIEGLMPEVARFEPRVALSGGKDGLDSYRKLAKQVVHMLTPRGIVAWEIGFGQYDSVAGMVKAAGLQIINCRHDLANVPRCIVATL